jgi:hypothetical protein
MATPKLTWVYMHDSVTPRALWSDDEKLTPEQWDAKRGAPARARPIRRRRRWYDTERS